MYIITIDGPASSGKGTVAKLISEQLGFHYLESGAIYRALALLVTRAKLLVDDELGIQKLIQKLDLSFIRDKVILDGEDITMLIRNEQIGLCASTIAKLNLVRHSLLEFQRNFAKMPGLVTDGRDMGSVVFPNATLKIFLIASAEVRAQRRATQLQKIGKSVKIADILRDIVARDAADSNRIIAPLSYDDTFRVLDNSALTIDETVATVIRWFNEVK